MGEIILCDENSGNTIYIIPAIIAFDSNGSYAPINAAYYSLEETNGEKYSLYVNVSSEWINSDERVFPVTIDPTLEIASTNATDTYNQNNGKLFKTTYGNGLIEEYVYDRLENLSETWYTKNGTRTLAYSYEYTTDGKLHKNIDYLIILMEQMQLSIRVVYIFLIRIHMLNGLPVINIFMLV